MSYKAISKSMLDTIFTRMANALRKGFNSSDKIAASQIAAKIDELFANYSVAMSQYLYDVEYRDRVSVDNNYDIMVQQSLLHGIFTNIAASIKNILNHLGVSKESIHYTQLPRQLQAIIDTIYYPFQNNGIYYFRTGYTPVKQITTEITVVFDNAPAAGMIGGQYKGSAYSQPGSISSTVDPGYSIGYSTQTHNTEFYKNGQLQFSKYGSCYFLQGQFRYLDMLNMIIGDQFNFNNTNESTTVSLDFGELNYIDQIDGKQVSYSLKQIGKIPFHAY